MIALLTAPLVLFMLWLMVRRRQRGVGLIAGAAVLLAASYALAATTIGDAAAADVSGQSLSSLAKFLVTAVEKKEWRAVIGASVFVIVALVRGLAGQVPLSWLEDAVAKEGGLVGKAAAQVARFASWLRTDRGGAFLVLSTSVLGAVGTGLLADNFTWSLLADGVQNAFLAAGGLTVVKRLVAPPDRKPGDGGGSSGNGNSSDSGTTIAPTPPPAPPPLAAARVALGMLCLFVLPTLTSCACWHSTDPKYTTPECIVARQSVDCTVAAAKEEAGRGAAFILNLIGQGTVDTSILIDMAKGAGFSFAECEVAKLAQDFTFKPMATPNEGRFLVSYRAWQRGARPGVKYKMAGH